MNPSSGRRQHDHEPYALKIVALHPVLEVGHYTVIAGYGSLVYVNPGGSLNGKTVTGIRGTADVALSTGILPAGLPLESAIVPDKNGVSSMAHPSLLFIL
jgi:hypothetical protein